MRDELHDQTQGCVGSSWVRKRSLRCYNMVRYLPIVECYIVIQCYYFTIMKCFIVYDYFIVCWH